MDFLFLFLQDFFQVITGAQTKRQVINCKKFLLYNCCVVIYIKINRCSSLYFYLIENSLIFSFFFFFFKTTMFVRDEKKLRTEFAASTFSVSFFPFSFKSFSFSFLSLYYYSLNCRSFRFWTNLRRSH